MYSFKFLNKIFLKNKIYSTSKVLAKKKKKKKKKKNKKPNQKKKKKKKNWTTKFLVYIIKVTMTAGKNPFAIKYYDGNQ